MIKQKIELKNGTLIIDNDKKLFNLCDFGSRINNKRGFLFVSKVMGKHLPTNPSIMTKTFIELGNKISKLNLIGDTLFIGFAETATCLGQGIFEHTKVWDNKFYINTTRYFYKDKPILINFEEEHSHATLQMLYDFENKEKIKNIVIIDDEFTTGKTLQNIISKLKEKIPSANRYICVSILNWIPKDIEVTISKEFISLYNGTFEFQKNDTTYDRIIDNVNTSFVLSIEQEHKKLIPVDYMERFGINATPLNIYNKAILEIKNEISSQDKILILGSGEFMYIPYKIAQFLENDKYDIKFQASTRSPINIDNCIYNKETFKDNYGENIPNYLYNLEKYDKIFFIVEENQNQEEIETILKKYSNFVKTILI